MTDGHVSMTAKANAGVYEFDVCDQVSLSGFHDLAVTVHFNYTITSVDLSSASLQVTTNDVDFGYGTSQ
jgi:hypothetical protein